MGTTPLQITKANVARMVLAMARKLKHDNLPEIIGMNLDPARDVIEFMFEKRSKRGNTSVVNLKTEGLVLAHQSCMALCKLAAQRILTDGWMHGEQLCCCHVGDEPAKLIHRMRQGIVKATGARLVIENNKLKSYRIGIDGECLSFTVSDLDKCDDAQVVALIKMVQMKRPEAVNGNPTLGSYGATPSAGPNSKQGME